MMKKTLLSLATVLTAGVLSMAANCSDSNVESCTADTDCTTEGQICDVAAEQCVDPQCTENEDCALSNATTEFVCPFGKGGDTCETDFDACNPDPDLGVVGIVDTLGNEYCALEESADVPCTDIDGVAVTVEAVDGGTATVCVDAAGTCTDGFCG